MTGNLTRTFDDVKARLDDGAMNDVQVAVATTTGALAYLNADAAFVTITSSAAAKIVFLPAAVTGKVLRLFVVANGCEVRSAVAADKLNDVVIGATNEAALAAAIIYTLVYNNGNWVCTGQSVVGAVSTLVVPDAV